MFKRDNVFDLQTGGYVQQLSIQDLIKQNVKPVPPKQVEKTIKEKKPEGIKVLIEDKKDKKTRKEILELITESIKNGGEPKLKKKVMKGGRLKIIE